MQLDRVAQEELLPQMHSVTHYETPELYVSTLHRFREGAWEGGVADLMVACRPQGGVEGLGADHELAREPAHIVLLVHDGQPREVVPLVRLAAGWGHVHGDHDSGQRSAVQPHKRPLVLFAICRQEAAVSCIASTAACLRDTDCCRVTSQHSAFPHSQALVLHAHLSLPGGISQGV